MRRRLSPCITAAVVLLITFGSCRTDRNTDINGASVIILPAFFCGVEPPILHSIYATYILRTKAYRIIVGTLNF
jgi:hypothetical protein